MNAHALVQSRIVAALQALEREGVLRPGLDFAATEVAPPRDAAHGELASNAAMVLAKPARMKPRDIAEKLAAKLADAPDIAKVEIAGPGFVNLTFAPRFWQGVVAQILKEGDAYGRTNVGESQRINIEYVSANPTGPMHVGHCRGAVFGDALANLLAFVNYDVTREYYINDAGGQVDILARSAFLRYREALGEEIGPIPAGLYPGDYLKPVGARLAALHGRSLLDLAEERWLPVVREEAVAAMLAAIKDDLAALNIHHDVFFSERSLTQCGHDEVKVSIDELRAKGMIFEGRLPKPKGHDEADWEDREQTLFRSTAFGDDVDRALQKSDGSYTYFASDLAYHHNKLARGFLHLINVFGADHVGYISRMRAAVTALSEGKADLDIKVCQLVKLLRAGEPVRMSKRSGTFVTLRDVVEEVGRDPVRFMMLYRKNDAPLDFDLAKVLEQSKDNPVFYVQYAHTRAKSVFRNVREVFPHLSEPSPDLLQADLTRLTDPGEIDLMRKLAAFPVVLTAAARSHEPHRLAFYLYDLASAFHAQWTKGNEMPHLRFIQAADGTLTTARLALILANQQVLATGLAILGVHAPVEMR
ncbi:MAG TPA: arginine--tRNA ligase [Hyphomicrobiaceae bacterium]|jgi:arginyl-tRNA synthetase|nr:arginine--tRNA ligase [Hyphomicrobiaceae bacterium]